MKPQCREQKQNMTELSLGRWKEAGIQFSISFGFPCCILTYRNKTVCLMWEITEKWAFHLENIGILSLRINTCSLNNSKDVLQKESPKILRGA